MQLYKFSSISQRSITSLVTGKFWAATLNNMNDPFEDRFQDKNSKRIVDNCGVFCVSGLELGERNVLTDPLMWAHYTSNHSGIAIGLKTLSDKPLPSKIEYLEEIEITKRFETLMQNYRGQKGKVVSPWQEIFFKFKPNFWSYENEFRRVYLGAANQYVDPYMEINEIIFGFRSKPEDEVAVWAALKDSITYKKATNISGKIEIKSYKPPTKIVTDNHTLLPLDQTGVDITKIKETKSIPSQNFNFE